MSEGAPCPNPNDDEDAVDWEAWEPSSEGDATAANGWEEVAEEEVTIGTKHSDKEDAADENNKAATGSWALDEDDMDPECMDEVVMPLAKGIGTFSHRFRQQYYTCLSALPSTWGRRTRSKCMNPRA